MPHDRVDVEEDHSVPFTAAGPSSVVLVCEHASNHIPPIFAGLGLSEADRKSHAAWDPGALAVAEHIADRLKANLVAARVSRLVYDCNRSPDAPDAMPVRSEVIEVPGNRNLSENEKEARIETCYHPFRDALHDMIRQVADPVIVTIHSFTPTYYGKMRSVEIGILHDSDARLADAMLVLAAAYTSAEVARNEPYGPNDGVTHTLKEHAIQEGHLNVMLEVRSDLIATAGQQENMAATISNWLVAACAQLHTPGIVQCRV